MSLATTCSHCGTCFRVVQDQLRISEGWVRCGHCQQVFNALESLFDLDAPNEPVNLGFAASPPPSDRGRWQTEAEAAGRWMRQHSRDAAAGPSPAPADPDLPARPPSLAPATATAPVMAAPEQPPAAAMDTVAPVASSWHRPASYPGEREEPLSDDMLAALRAEAAQEQPDEEEENEAAPSAAVDEHAADAVPPLMAQAPQPVVEPLLAPPDDDADGPSEPAPLDDDSSNETAFAPLPITSSRQEPFFEATQYEPREFVTDGAHQAPPALDPPAPAAPSEDTLQRTLPLEVAGAALVLSTGESPLPAESTPIERTDEGPGENTGEDADAGPPSAAMFLTTDGSTPADDLAADTAEDTEDDAPARSTFNLGVVAAPAVIAAETAPALTPELPSFLTDAAERERWEGGPARWAFGITAGVLALALVAQVAWHWRERLAMAWPITQPALSALCGWTGCTLGAPREIGAVVVDNTALARPPGTSGYRLAIQLHNRSTHPVATPNVDLTLTDAQGAVVSRRVLTPMDFGYADPTLPAQADLQWTAEFTLAEGSLVGYTVAAFYP